VAFFFFLSVALATDLNNQFLQKASEGSNYQRELADAASSKAHPVPLPPSPAPTPFVPPRELTTPGDIMDAFADAFQGKTKCGHKYEVSNYLFLRQIGDSDYLSGHPYRGESEKPGGWNGEAVSSFIGAHAISTLLETYCCGADMKTSAGFSRCWCNYYAALGEPVNVSISPGNLSVDPGDRRQLVVIQGNPDDKAWEPSSGEPDQMVSLVQATYENVLALMPQTFPILFKGNNFDFEKHCPHGSVSAKVIQELKYYDQGCFQYKKGFVELYDYYADEFNRIGFSDSGKNIPKYANEMFKMQKLCAGDSFTFTSRKANKAWYANATEFLQKLEKAAMQGNAPTPFMSGFTKHPLCESTPWVRAYLFWAYGETGLFLGDGTTPGSPEYIVVPVDRHGLLKLKDLPTDSSMIKPVRELMNLNGKHPGPHASCLITYEKRTYGWSVNATRH